MADLSTLQGIQDRVHTLTEGDTSTPATTDDEWGNRLAMINDAIHRWERVDAVDWQELRSTLTDAADGTKTTTASTATYSAPTNFVKPGGYVWVTDSAGAVTYYEVIPSLQSQLYKADVTKKFAYFTGNPSAGFTLHINPAPTATGSTIDYEYYKKATELANTTDKTECPDPNFIVHYTVSQIHRQNRDMTRATDELSTAEELLQQMQAQNEISPPYQDNQMRDLSRIQGKGFGV